MTKQKNKNFKKFNLFTIAIFILATVFFIFSHQAQAEGHNVRGHAWSENIGWISFNCDDHGTCETIDYGVDIDTDTGKFSGWAWSENVGWINFDNPLYPLSGCPEEPCSAKLEIETACNQPAEKVNGWTQVVSTGGWIKMSGITQDANPYGIERDNTNKNELTGWAWSEDFGWISFNCKNEGSCTEANYKVTTTFSPSYNPKATYLIVSKDEDNCTYNELNSQKKLSWTFQPCVGGDTQTDYQIQISTTDNFTNPDVVNIRGLQKGEVFGTNNFYLTLAQENLPDEKTLKYGETYFWRVSVQNNNGPWSDWAVPTPDSFSTPTHPYPEASLECSKFQDGNCGSYGPCENLSVSAGEKICFRGNDPKEVCGGLDLPECNGLSITNRTWSFGNSCVGNGDCLTEEICIDNVCEKTIPPGDPTINTIERIYSTGQLSKSLSLEITDSDGYTCSDTSSFKDSKINFPLPIWKEVIPKD